MKVPKDYKINHGCGSCGCVNLLISKKWAAAHFGLSLPVTFGKKYGVVKTEGAQ